MEMGFVVAFQHNYVLFESKNKGCGIFPQIA